MLKKCGAIICRALLRLIQSQDGTFNSTKIILILFNFSLYSLIFTWKFALLIMIAIGVHESGHVWAMNKVGQPNKGFYFIPLFGGAAIADGYYKSLKDKIIVIIMGPMWGMMLALVTWIIYLITGNIFLGVAAYWQALMNLFNLIPVNPLDGGQIFRSIISSINKRVADTFSLLSCIAFALLFVKFLSPLLALAVLLSGIDFWTNYKVPASDEVTKLTRQDIIITIVAYISLGLTLAIIMWHTSEMEPNLLPLFLK